MMIVIVDYGLGNLGSIQNMIKKAGGSSVISSDPKDIEKADKLILPGVGAFDNGMSNIKKMGLIDVLNTKVLKQKTPVLGLCLGMQLFAKSSEEGKLPGLAWIDSVNLRFNFDDTRLKVPHMGWNELELKKKSALFDGMPEEKRFYFVHSYHMACNDKADILATTNYGIDFVSAIQKGNIFGTQFHPEKSHKFGLMLFRNFIEKV